MKIRLGIIGLGNVAKAQIGALNRLDKILLVGGYDINKNTSILLPKNAIFYHNLESFISSPEIDIILVSTPNRSHYELGMHVLSSGRSLVLEKPVSHNFNDIISLKEIADSKHLHFSVALHATQSYEVQWWLKQNAMMSKEMGELTGFSCYFYDPYIISGKLLGRARGLGGSWFDSGINALSVVGLFIPPEHLNLEDSTMTKIDGIDCEQIHGQGLFNFKTESGNIGRGNIDTNWSLGRNNKITHLYYDSEGFEVILNHSLENLTIKHRGSTSFEKKFSDGNSRLENHYLGVFSNLLLLYESHSTNIDYAIKIHKLLFKALGNRT